MGKTFKRILASVLTAVMLLTAAPIAGFAVGLDDDPLDYLEYEINDGEVTITGYKGPMMSFANPNDIYIPEEIEGYPVTKIGDRAFAGEEYLNTVTIPDSLTYIGESAFSGCRHFGYIYGFEHITYIGPRAFYECYAFGSLTIPESLENIGPEAFYYCRGLESVTISDGVKSIGENAFSCCFFLKEVSLPDSLISIGDGAFSYCEKLESVTIPDAELSIGNGAFSDCESLTSITIPEKVKSIGGSAFYNCTSLETIIYNANPVSGNAPFGDSDSLDPANYNELSVTIGDNVKFLPDYLFSDCKRLKSITIPDSVTSIGNEVFSGCSSLESVKLPKDLTSIESGTFRDCLRLTDTTIPNGVTSIGSEAFRGCQSIDNIAIPNGVTSIEKGTFYECFSLANITIPDGVTSIGSEAFYNCFEGLTSVSIPDSVTSIGSKAFYGCDKLTSISIPDGVTSIGESAFEYCGNLNKITIPNGIVSIERSTFEGCYSLTSIKIPNGVISLGDSAFRDCTGLTIITIPESVTNIGAYALNGCTSLGKIIIPYSINSIGSAAFTGCTNLGSMTVYSRDCTFADDSTANCTMIYGFTGSTAETYANEKGFDFVAIDDTHTHVYDNDCDSICNLCGDESALRGHTYDSDCDTECNVCGALRDSRHVDNDANGFCDNCGAYLSDIALSTVKNVDVSAGETVYLKFIAPYTGRYTFYSSSDLDTYGYVCDSNKISFASDDESGSNSNFSITETLTKGTVYYLGVRYYSPDDSGIIPVTINYICEHPSTHIEHKDSTCTEHGYDKSVCDICGATVSTTELPYKHDYATTVTDPTCTEQGYTTYTCSLCGESYIADYTEPLNHPQKTWRVTKNPTATSTGLMIETCDLCGAKTGEMEIPMLIPNYVTGITVSPNRLALNVGETANLTAVITPDTAENKNVIWSSSDTAIATVADGVVTAKTPGVAVIIAQSEDGGYKDICVVRVASLTPVNGAVVDNENGLIYGIASNSADINSYVNTVDDTMTVECDSALLGTGSVVNIVKDDVIVDSYKIVLFGDVNGDGWYDGMDAVTVSCIANGMLTKDQIGEAAYMAADCNHDGVVDEFDVAILNQAGVLLANVDQTKTQEELAADSDYIEYLSLIDQTAGADTEQEPDKTYESIIEMIIDFIKTVFEILISLFQK